MSGMSSICKMTISEIFTMDRVTYQLVTDETQNGIANISNLMGIIIDFGFRDGIDVWL